MCNIVFGVSGDVGGDNGDGGGDDSHGAWVYVGHLYFFLKESADFYCLFLNFINCCVDFDFFYVFYLLEIFFLHNTFWLWFPVSQHL